jgi:hypothetical protein
VPRHAPGDGVDGVLTFHQQVNTPSCVACDLLKLPT